MNRVPVLVLLVAFLASCGSPAPIPSPTPTSSSLAIPQSFRTSAQAELYSGPGNLEFEVMVALPAGEMVTPVGWFGDFVKVYVSSLDMNGYLWMETMGGIPMDVPELTAGEVPWISEDFIADSCLGPFTSVGEDGVATIQNYTEGPGWYSLEGDAKPLGAETRLRVQMSTSNGNWAVIDLSDTDTRTPNSQWPIGFRRLTIYVENGQYWIGFWDGRSLEDGYFSIPLPELGNDPFELVILGESGDQVEIRDLDGNVIRQYTTKGSFFFEGVTAEFPDGLFPGHTLYVNCAQTGPTTLTMTAHTMLRAPTGTWQPPRQPLPSLRDLAAEHGIDIMVPVEGWRLGDSRYRNIVLQQVSLNYAFGTSPMAWMGVYRYNLEFLDHLTEYFLAQGWKLRLAIVSPYIEDQPADLQNGNFTREEYIRILQDYVTTITCRYRDRITVWEIAGEAPGTYVANTPDFWRDRIGPEYIDMAFTWARECDPDGVLVFTGAPEFVRDEETRSYQEIMYGMVTGMLSRGVPIDAIGMEGHFFLPSDSLIPPTKEAVIEAMQVWGDLGLDVYITEMDVTLSLLEGTREEKWALQAQVYKTMMDACIEAGNCRSFGVFGIDDGHAWSMCMPGLGCPPEVPPDALWFDMDYNPKPAFYAVLQSLEEHRRTR